MMVVLLNKRSKNVTNATIYFVFNGKVVKYLKNFKNLL